MSTPRSDLVRIGTRSSEVALRQARRVQASLEALGIESTLVPFRTAGDKKLDETMTAADAVGMFTREIDAALLRKKIDLAVHALPHVSTAHAEGISLAAVLPRDDPRDALVVNGHILAASLADLPSGSRVATASLHRRAQLRAKRRDLDVAELRGDLPDRLKKVDEGRVHAGIFTAASLVRLGAMQHVTCYLNPPDWLPAAGQGAIAVQARTDDEPMLDLARSIGDASTWIDVSAERAFLAALEGGFQVPIAALVVNDGTTRMLHGLIADPLGARVVRGSIKLEDDAELGGIRLANELRGEGASEILEGLRRGGNVPRPQPE